MQFRKEMVVAWTSDGAGEKWSDPGYTLKTEPVGFAETLTV